MEAKAHLRNARIAPRKVQIVFDLIRNQPVDVAMAILKNTPKAACEPLEKLLKSAAANAENNHAMKRIRPRARGRAYRVLKRTSHMTIVLKEKE